jgi:hypothetical protein
MTIRTLLSHLSCCAISLYFFSSLLHIASADLPPFIPNSVNLGLIGSLVFQQLSPNLEYQIFGVLANIFGIPYNPARDHTSRERSPDLELGNGGDTTGPNISPDMSNRSIQN